MDFLSTTFYFIVAIFILVTAHELGHFLTAKLFGMRVDKFYIGFDFYNLRFWKKKIGDTEYGIGAFPLGGYVKIAGMVDESLDTEHHQTAPQPWEFRAKPVWQRLIVLAGGVAMNMILAAAIDDWEEVLAPENFAGQTLTYTVVRNGERKTLQAPADILTQINENQALGIRPLMAPVIDQVLGNQPAAKAGLKPGALITAINDKPVNDWAEVVETISANPGNAITIAWKYLAPPADGMVDVAKIREFGTLTVSDVVPASTGKIGIALKQTLVIDHRRLNPAEATLHGLEQTWQLTATTVKGFGKILTGQEDFRKSLGGPIKIARIANQSAEQGLSSFMYFLALLSISLAFINILPIPALDGGQFVLNAIEGIIGHEIPFQLKMRIQQIGMALLLTLFLFFIINDLINP